jgi:hypothetical protein
MKSKGERQNNFANINSDDRLKGWKIGDIFHFE